jgi:hypothetical protein
VKYGSLTKNEVKSLVQREKDFAEFEKSLKGDGDLTKEEREQLHGELNDLSKEIFEEKHNTEVRGPDTAENARIRNRLGTGALSRERGREICRKAGRLGELRRKLSEKLTDEERGKLQGEHDRIVDELFETEEDGGGAAKDAK